MASLTIRNIPEEAKQRFRERAAANGRSMEEEARQIIMAAATRTEPRKGIFEMLYEGTRPGFDMPEVRDSPATYATFEE